MPATTTISQLVERYDTLLLDAYGVLLDGEGPLPGAVALLERLKHDAHPYLLLTNSASRLPQTMSRDLCAMGLPVPPEQILSSGMLLEPLFAERGLQGARCLVLGPGEAHEYVRRAGGEALPPAKGMDAEVVVIADQKGFDLQQGLDHTLTMLLRRLERGEATELLLCNPDLLYPAGKGEYGITAGALAALLEAILAERYGVEAPQFEPLGKPHRPLFEAAAQRCGGHMVMVGDTLETDILGAQRHGIAAALVLSGLARQPEGDAAIIPDYLIPSLQA